MIKDNDLPDAAGIGFEHAPVGLAVARHRVIVRCNARFMEIFGYPRGELEGESLSKLYPTTEEFQRIGAIGLEIMRRSGRYDDERIMKRRDDTLFWCRVRGESLTPEDPFACSVWSFADISDKWIVTSLSQRERQVAMLLTGVKTSKEIARDLNISPRTVEAHRARLMKRLDARNTAELVACLSGPPL